MNSTYFFPDLNDAAHAEPPRYEIVENKFYSYDVYDIRLSGKRWLACFRMFKDAAAWVGEPHRSPQECREADRG